MDDLTAQELALLDFEDQWWRAPGRKEAAIRAQFGVTATRYYQRLNGLIDRPEALAARPLVVRRLGAMRERRQRQHGRRLGAWPRATQTE